MTQNPLPKRNPQTPEQKFMAVSRLTGDIEEDFLTLGQILSEIKASKTYQFKGYETFATYLQDEHHFSTAIANKLIAIYNLFVNEMDLDDATLVEIGYDRLCIILPAMKKADWQTRDELIIAARDCSSADLKAQMKARREAEKEADIDLKQVFVDQYFERMLSFLNCSKKELNFKLALYFNSFTEEDMQDLKEVIKTNQKEFDRQIKEAENEHHE